MFLRYITRDAIHEVTTRLVARIRLLSSNNDDDDDDDDREDNCDVNCMLYST